VGVRVGQRVSVGRGVGVGIRVDVAVGVRVEGRVDVLVGVRLGVQVGQRVSLGPGVWLGTGVLVNVCAGVEDRVGVSVGAGVLVRAGVFVCVSEGTFVVVHSGEAEGEVRNTDWVTSPVKIIPAPATIVTIKINASPKYRQPAAICLRRSGQLAWRRLTCKERTPARILKKTPSKPRKMAMMRPIGMPMQFIIACGEDRCATHFKSATHILLYSKGLRKWIGLSGKRCRAACVRLS
jgi:hypothetical protein